MQQAPLQDRDPTSRSRISGLFRSIAWSFIGLVLAIVTIVALRNTPPALWLKRAIVERLNAPVSYNAFPSREAVLEIVRTLLSVAGIAVGVMVASVALRRSLKSKILRAIFRVTALLMMPVLIFSVALAAGEWWCFTHPLSHASNQSMSSRRWADLYLKFNGQGFRDTRDYVAGDKGV